MEQASFGALAASALAVVCCAGFPLVAGIAGGATLAAVGVAGALVVVAAVAVAFGLRSPARRRTAQRRLGES